MKRHSRARRRAIARALMKRAEAEVRPRTRRAGAGRGRTRSKRFPRPTLPALRGANTSEDSRVSFPLVLRVVPEQGYHVKG